MNRARRKGTEGENYFLPYLRSLFGEQVERLDNVARHTRATDGDYVGVPWLHEAKYTDRAGLTAWIRICRKKRPLGDWTLLWKGDTRTLDGQPIVVMSLPKYMELVRSWKLHEASFPALVD